jgi:hypothetical protein
VRDLAEPVGVVRGGRDQPEAVELPGEHQALGGIVGDHQHARPRLARVRRPDDRRFPLLRRHVPHP